MASRLRPVPETAPRAIGLIRVSKERDGMISPDVQRSAITDYAAARGYDVTGWLEGLDESGSRSRSAWWPRLDQAIAQVEAGEYDVVLVWKFSRTARHRLRWAVALDRIEEAGGRLESATEQVDVTTSTGRFTRGMLAELNAFEAERIGEVWREVHARRIATGRPASGKDRWGYRYDREQKLHVPDPETGPVLADLYRRYVAGESFYALVRWLNAHGWKTHGGRTWSDTQLRRVMDSGFAAGRFQHEGQWYDGVHEPAIDAATWQAYLDGRHVRRALPARTQRSQYLLSGLVRCSRCGGPMVAGQLGARTDATRVPKYRCQRAKTEGPEVCVGGYVDAPFVEAHVLEWLRSCVDDVDQRAIDQAANAARRSAVRSDQTRLARELVRVEEALSRLATQNALDPLPPAAYRRSRAELDEQHTRLTAALEDARRRERQVVDDPGAVAAGLLEEWEVRPVEHRREVLRQLMHCVLVTTGRPRARIRVVESWELRRL